MFGNYVYEKSSAQYNDRILLIDDENFEETTKYSTDFLAHGFEVVQYKDDLSFRLEYEDKVKKIGNKIVVLANSESYIPYDIWCRLHVYVVSFVDLFPKLNVEVIKGKFKVDLDLICAAYKNNFDDLQQKYHTEAFLQTKVYSKANVQLYLQYRLQCVQDKTKFVDSYKDWFAIVEEKATIDVVATKYGIYFETSEINSRFKEYILQYFGKLSQSLDVNSPVLVSKTMEYMHDRSKKYVLIVMDGMSEFDWSIIADSFKGIQYKKSSVFAMIPTTTSISRQCLLSNKYPSQLINPWSQNKEKHEFVTCAKELGFTDDQIGYERGYNTSFSSFVRCGAIIINDVDDLVHAQKQGRLGMFNDVTVLVNQNKLVETTKRMLEAGYDVYITADHGNTPCKGLGKYMGAGVEVETKSRRMMVLKDFADKTSIIERYGMVDYPKYYLKKDYDYLICDIGTSLDAKDEDVMSHGGITIDEVVVPFITIKAEGYNG